MNSVDKLREAAKLLEVTGMRPSLYEIADEIECEIERGYMELPKDANGEPIHVGDVLEQGGVEIGSVTAVGFHGEPRVWVLPSGKNVSISFCAKHVTHYHEPTVEDVLEEFYDALGWDEADNHALKHDEIIAEYADKLREVLGK